MPSKLASHHVGHMTGVPQVLSKPPLGPIRNRWTVAGTQQICACQSPSGFPSPSSLRCCSSYFVEGLAQKCLLTPGAGPQHDFRYPMALQGCSWCELAVRSHTSEAAILQYTEMLCAQKAEHLITFRLLSHQTANRQRVFSQTLEGSKGKEDHYKGV